MKSYSSLPLEAGALVWWHKLGRSLAVVHLFGKRQWFWRFEDKKNDMHVGQKQLREGILVSQSQPWPIFIARGDAMVNLLWDVRSDLGMETNRRSKD